MQRPHLKHWADTTPDHEWNVSPAQARAIQESLRERVITEDHFGEIRTVAGVDIGIKKGLGRAAAVLLDFPSLAVRDYVVITAELRFPYVPGLLSFRECPPALAALRALPQRPDLLLCDGQGLAHPRRFGIACHLGLLLDLPAIGAAKSRLIGSHDEPAAKRGSQAPLFDAEEQIGAVVRTRTNVRPIYVSVGHRVSLETAVALALNCAPRYRIPEPTRQAHKLASG